MSAFPVLRFSHKRSHTSSSISGRGMAPATMGSLSFAPAAPAVPESPAADSMRSPSTLFFPSPSPVVHQERKRGKKSGYFFATEHPLVAVNGEHSAANGSATFSDASVRSHGYFPVTEDEGLDSAESSTSSSSVSVASMMPSVMRELYDGGPSPVVIDNADYNSLRNVPVVADLSQLTRNWNEEYQSVSEAVAERPFKHTTPTFTQYANISVEFADAALTYGKVSFKCAALLFVDCAN
jgi:hypothetical protein